MYILDELYTTNQELSCRAVMKLFALIWNVYSS